MSMDTPELGEEETFEYKLEKFQILDKNIIRLSEPKRIAERLTN